MFDNGEFFRKFQKDASDVPWEQAAPFQREIAILEALISNEVSIADPEWSRWHMAASAEIEDPADLMRLDIGYSNKVAQLRQAGLISSAEELRLQAKEMIDLAPDDMRRTLTAHFKATAKRMGK